MLFTSLNKIEFIQWEKSDISPIGKLQIREDRAETVDTEHVQTDSFLIPEAYRYITWKWVSTKTNLGVENDHLPYI